MHYLTRALPASETKHYALIESGKDDEQRWKFLGIETILYPNSNGHLALNAGIKRLSITISRGFLDWEREISELAQRPPPLRDEESDTIEEALRDEAKTEFFTKHASSPKWISWLEQRKHLGALFDTENALSERDRILSW